MPRRKIGTNIGLTLPLTLTILLLSWSSPVPIRQVLAETKDRQAEADRLLQQGIEKYQASQFQAAIESWQQGLTLYQHPNNSQQQKTANEKPSKSDNNQQQNQDTNEKKIYPQKAVMRKQAKTLNNLGAAYYSLEKYHQAIDYYQQCLTISQQLGDRYGEGKTLNSLGRIYYVLGKYTQAIGLYRQSLAIAKAIKIPQGQGVTLGNLGDAYTGLKDYDRAINYYQQSITITRKIGDRYDESQYLASMGIAYNGRGESSKAVEHFQRSLKLAREIGARQIERTALQNLGITYYYLGEYSQAINYQQQSLVLAREISAHSQEIESLNNLGRIYQSQGDQSKAADYYQQSLALARQIGNRQQEAKSLGNLSMSYHALGDNDKAIKYQQQSLVLARKIGDRQQQAESLGNLGTIRYALQDYSKAIDYYQKQLSIIRAVDNRDRQEQALINLGRAYLATSNHVKVIETYKQILHFVNQSDRDRERAIALGILGKTYLALGNYTMATEYLQPYLAITQKMKDLQGQKIALNALGVAFFHTGNLEAAEKLLREKIEIDRVPSKPVDSNDALQLFLSQQQTNPYQILQQVLVAENKPEEALEIAERQRKKILPEVLRDSSLEKLQALKKPVSLKQIQQIAQQQKATLVSYSLVSATELYIWTIEPTGEINFSSVDLSHQQQSKQILPLASLVSQTLESISDSSSSVVPPASQTKLLQQLYQVLIQPITHLLPTDPKEPVIFVTPKELFLVPFSALQDERGKYLIEKHTIAKTPSIQLLGLTQQPKKAQKQENKRTGNDSLPVLVVGNTAISETVASVLKTQIIAATQATETEIKQKMPTAPIVHLVTNGLFNKSLGSAIALVPSEEDDGWLTPQEILQMNLNAELVILNNSNLKEGLINSNGAISLSGSLISAGVEGVIISLWSNSDASTADFMREFYLHWQKDSNKAQALRQAMLTTMKIHPLPQDWAGFILVGEAL